MRGDYRPKRMATKFPVTLKTADGDRAVTMLDISLDGARLSTQAPILAGEAVTLQIGPSSVAALVQWSKSSTVGVRFMERPDPTMIDLIPEDD